MAVTNLQQAGVAQNQTADPRKDKQKGTGFTNINKVLDANQDNKLGQTVSSGLQQTGQNIQQSVERAKDRFGKSLEQGSLGEQQAQERQELLKKAEQGQEISDQDSGRFGRLSSGQYTGQTGLENAEGLKSDAAQAENLAKGSNTQQGRYGLLQQFVGSPKYTQGTMRTDSLLLGQAAPELRQASSDLKSATRGVNTATNAATVQAEQAKAQTAGFSQETQKMLTDSTSGLYDPIAAAQKAALERAPVAEQDFQSLNQNLEALLRGGKDFAEYSGPKNLEQLGIDDNEIKTMQDQYKTLMNSGMSGAQAANVLKATLKQNMAGTDVLSNIGSFMNEDQARSLNALAKLGGKDTTDYQNLGSFTQEGVDLTDQSSVGALADARNKQKQLNDQTSQLSHYVTNSKDATQNALSGSSQVDRQFFASQDPSLQNSYSKLDGLKQQLKNPPKDRYGKPDREAVGQAQKYYNELYRQIEAKQNQVINNSKNTIANNKKQTSQMGSLDSIDAYKKYLGTLPGGGKVGLF